MIIFFTFNLNIWMIRCVIMARNFIMKLFTLNFKWNDQKITNYIIKIIWNSNINLKI